MPSSSKNRYSRQQMRARFRKPRRRRSGSFLWGLVIGVIVIVGIGMVWAVRDDRESQAGIPPRVGDHWHSFLAINVCGSWQPNWPEFDSPAGQPGIQTGLHSHADGNIHIHPVSTREAGNNATLGRFVDNGGGSISSGSIELWDGAEHRNGDVCGPGAQEGREGVLQWTVDGEVREGNPADQTLADGEILAVYFLPEGAELDAPPGAADALSAPIDLAPPNGVEVPAPDEPASSP